MLAHFRLTSWSSIQTQLLRLRTGSDFAPEHLPAPDYVLHVSAPVRRAAVADARLGPALCPVCLFFLADVFFLRRSCVTVWRAGERRPGDALEMPWRDALEIACRWQRVRWGAARMAPSMLWCMLFTVSLLVKHVVLMPVKSQFCTCDGASIPHQHFFVSRNLSVVPRSSHTVVGGPPKRSAVSQRLLRC